MATTIHVKEKTKWKKVKIDNDLFSQEALDGIIEFEQLDDYELLNYEGLKKTGKSKAVSGDDDKDPGSKQMKKKKKKGKNRSTENIPEVLDSDVQKMENNSLSTKKPDELLNSDGKKKKKRKKKKKPKSTENIVMAGQNIEVLDEITGIELGTEPNKKKKKQPKRKSEDTGAGSPKKKQKKSNGESSETQNEMEDIEPDLELNTTGMEGWQGLYVPEEVLWALKGQKFFEPTPIQRMVLPSAIRDRMDIVGAAQTGSGKTLGFGIPILHFILEHRKNKEIEADNINDELANADNDDDDNDVSSEQGTEDSEEGSDDDETEVTEDLIEDNSDEESGEEEEEMDDEVQEDLGEEDGGQSGDEDLENIGEGIGCVNVVKDADFSWLKNETPTIQSTTTKRYPLALVLEPTRELAIQVRNHIKAAAKYTDIQVVAIVGGLASQKQKRLLRRCPDVIVATPGRLWDMVQEGEVYLSEIEKTKLLVVDEADRMVEKGHFEELSKLLERMNSEKLIEHRHTYVFSATLTMLHSGPQRQLKKKKKIKLDEKNKIEMLMKNIGLKPKPKIVDLSPKVGTVETLTEARINCTKEEKDMYLYYFLKQYPGRTLVFANSKDCIRRLLSIFNMLQVCPLPLHADMHQRQRLKNLDRFTANPNGLLLASDVAARGLDIPNVQHVIHYQVPHTVENYVHRSGRTARALKEGISVMFIGAEDMKNYRKIIHTLNKGEDLPMFPVEQQYMVEYRRRVNLVRQIETKEYRFNKSKRQNTWFEKAAEEIGVDLEDENLLNDLGDEQEQQDHKRFIKQLKADLSMMLKIPVLPSTIGGKYPTKTGKLALPPSKNLENSAIIHVKKDRKTQDKMLEHIRTHPTVVKEKKKKKWKKKNKN